MIKRIRVEKLQNIEIKYTEADLRALPHLASKSISYSHEILLQDASCRMWQGPWIRLQKRT